jgi:hypothetical protein
MTMMVVTVAMLQQLQQHQVQQQHQVVVQTVQLMTVQVMATVVQNHGLVTALLIVKIKLMAVT